jgi:hypothetical protein
MEFLQKIGSYIDAFRPCKQTVAVIEENVEATRELNSSITRLTETLVGSPGPVHRSTDESGDESWRNRRTLK